MFNLIQFMNAFLSYFILFGVMVTLAVIGGFVGVTMRKRKNAKEHAEATEEGKATE